MSDTLRTALESISKNSCCDRCQEAALVARAALSGRDDEMEELRRAYLREVGRILDGDASSIAVARAALASAIPKPEKPTRN